MAFDKYLQGKKQDRSNTLSGIVGLHNIKTNTLIPEDEVFIGHAFHEYGIATFIRFLIDEAAAFSSRGITPNRSFFTESGMESDMRNALDSDGDGDLYPDGAEDQDINTNADRWGISIGASSESDDPNDGPYSYARWAANTKTRNFTTTGGTEPNTYTIYHWVATPYEELQAHIDAINDETDWVDSDYIQEWLDLDISQVPLGDIIDEFNQSGLLGTYLSKLSTLKTKATSLYNDIVYEGDSGSGLSSPPSAWGDAWEAVEDLFEAYEEWDEFYASMFHEPWATDEGLSLEELWRQIVLTRVDKPSGTFTKILSTQNAIDTQFNTAKKDTDILEIRAVPPDEFLPTPRLMAAYYYPERDADDELIGTSNNLVVIAAGHGSSIRIFRASGSSIPNYMNDPGAVESQWTAVHATSETRYDNESNALFGEWKEYIPPAERGTFYWYRVEIEDDASVPPLGDAPSGVMPAGTTYSLMTEAFKEITPNTGKVTGERELRGVGVGSRIEVEDTDIEDDLGIGRGDLLMFEGMRGVFQVAKVGGSTMYVFPQINANTLNEEKEVKIWAPLGLIHSSQIEG